MALFARLSTSLRTMTAFELVSAGVVTSVKALMERQLVGACASSLIISNTVSDGSRLFSSSAAGAPGQPPQQQQAAGAGAGTGAEQQQHGGSSAAAGPSASAFSAAAAAASPSSVSPEEAAKFAALASRWWDPAGPFKALHELNPARCRFVRTSLADAFGRDAAAPAPLAGLRLLDVGCGGGILSESLAAMGARVLGIDVNAGGLATARAHADAGDPEIAARIEYRAALAEELAAEGAVFDAVISSEVIEHVESVPAFCASLAALTRPGGCAVLSTINRTPRAYAMAIGLGEHVLRWADPGTHDWSKFVTPEEMVVLMGGGCSSSAGSSNAEALAAGQQVQPTGAAGCSSSGKGLVLEQLAGMVFDPLAWRWRLSSDTAVNYIACFRKPE